MAIDTNNEKLALIEYGDVFQFGVPISADGIDQADNQQLLWDYPGLLWATYSANVLPLTALVPPGWYYRVRDMGGYVILEIGSSSPPTMEVDRRALAGMSTFSIVNWIENRIPA